LLRDFFNSILMHSIIFGRVLELSLTATSLTKTILILWGIELILTATSLTKATWILWGIELSLTATSLTKTIFRRKDRWKISILCLTESRLFLSDLWPSGSILCLTESRLILSDLWPSDSILYPWGESTSIGNEASLSDLDAEKEIDRWILNSWNSENCHNESGSQHPAENNTICGRQIQFYTPEENLHLLVYFHMYLLYYRNYQLL
jgi:hypothetical protein